MIKRSFILLILILFCSTNAFAKNPPPGTGTSNVPANILIMLDNSGSMSWDTNGRPWYWWGHNRNAIRMNLAKAAIRNLVSNTSLTSAANFGLQQWGWGHWPYNRVRVGVSARGAQTIFTDVNNVRGYGGTDLYRAMLKARQYWSSGADGFSTPIIQNASCQLNFIILISDGQWGSHNQAMSLVTEMKDRYNVKTFAVGFTVGTGNRRNYDDLALKGGTKKALYANNQAELITALTDAIQQAISGRLTFTTPAVMSDVQRGDYVYQSTFEYDKDKQWEGALKKYKLNSNGTFGAEQWNAADKLNSKSPSFRKLWTVGIGTKSTNNFTTSNVGALKNKLFPNKTNPTNSETNKLINYIRGIDSYDTDSDGRTNDTIHKLADIYHSELVVVGKPEASVADTGNTNFPKTDAYYRANNGYTSFKNNTSRKEVVIAGANNGILHAFDASNGDELWGYIPPNILGNLSTTITSKSNKTIPIYGVDGSPVVKDIFYDDTPNDGSNNPRWRTVLISGLGAGGEGFFALDITDTNNPRHLFAIENDTVNQQVKHWGENETLNTYSYSLGNTIASNVDYSKLGEAWSTPRIIKIKVDNKDRWVAVLGGGYNGASNPDVGSAVFIVDFENEGKLLKKIDITDNQNTSHNYVFGLPKCAGWASCIQSSFTREVPIPLSQFGLNSYNFKFYKIIIRGLGSSFSITQDESGSTARNIKLRLTSPLANAATVTLSVIRKTDIVNSIPSDLVVVTANKTDKATYDGALIYAADLEGKITKINLTENFSLNNGMISKTISTTTLFDSQGTTDNGRYIFKTPETTVDRDGKLWLYFGTGNYEKLQEQSSSTQNRLFGIKDEDFPEYKSTSLKTYSNCADSNSCPNSTQIGWYVNLRNAQKLSGSPTIDKDRVYFPIYEPTSQINACKTGKAIFTAYSSKCGAALQTVEVGTGVLSKVVKNGNNLYIGISGKAKTNATGFTNKDNLLSTTSKAIASGKAVQLEYWKENY